MIGIIGVPHCICIILTSRKEIGVQNHGYFMHLWWWYIPSSSQFYILYCWESTGFQSLLLLLLVSESQAGWSSCKPKLKVLNIWLIWSVYGCVHSESVRFFVRLPSGPRHDRQSLRARWLSRSPGHGCWSERFWCSTAARPKPISTVSQPTSARKFDTLTPGPGPWWVK